MLAEGNERHSHPFKNLTLFRDTVFAAAALIALLRLFQIIKELQLKGRNVPTRIHVFPLGVGTHNGFDTKTRTAFAIGLCQLNGICMPFVILIEVNI